MALRGALKLVLMTMAGWSWMLAAAATTPIAFKVPATWTLLGSRVQGGADVALYIVDAARDPENPSNALVSSYKLDPDMSMAQADQLVASRMKDVPNAIKINAAADGPNWKTYLYTASYEKKSLVILYRIGMSDGYGVEAMYSFGLAPSDTKSSATLTLQDAAEPAVGIYTVRQSAQTMVDQFNAFASTLTIAGKNQFQAKAVLIEQPAAR